jgi:hypothetical protein
MTLFPMERRYKKGVAVLKKKKTWGKPFSNWGVSPCITPRFREMSAVDHTIAKFIQGQNSLSHIFKKFRDIKQWDESTVLSIYQSVGLSCNYSGDESNFPPHGNLTDTSCSNIALYLCAHLGQIGLLAYWFNFI